MLTKSILKFIFSVFSILLVVVALTYCGSGSDSPSSDEQGSGTNLAMDFAVPESLASAAIINALQAEATIDGGGPHPLTVHPVTNQISGTITGVSSGTHDLGITYFVSTLGGDVVLCTYATLVTVYPGQTTTVIILDTDLDRNIDDDHDGYTNLAEVRIGTDALDVYDVPAGESPHVVCGNGTTQILKSANFDAAVVMGPAVAGKASSTSFDVVVSFGGYE